MEKNMNKKKEEEEKEQEQEQEKKEKEEEKGKSKTIKHNEFVLLLGDIIEIKAEKNPELNEKTFLIEYIDTKKLKLLNIYSDYRDEITVFLDTIIKKKKKEDENKNEKEKEKKKEEEEKE